MYIRQQKKFMKHLDMILHLRAEAKRQLDLMDAGLPRFPKGLMTNVFQNYREKYKYALKLQRWPLKILPRWKRKRRRKLEKLNLEDFMD